MHFGGSGPEQFRLLAAAQMGLARGTIDYRDGTKRDTMKLSGIRASAQTAHIYLVPGTYKPTLTLDDAAGEKAVASDSVFVRANQLPQIIYMLTGTEGLVSRVAKRALATDPEGDSLTISVSPVSSGLVFQMNARNDSAIYYLTNRDDNGTKQGKITVVDQKNRTIDSSFVATYQVSPGDQTFDIGVETNAGTGMPLARLLSMYQLVNYRTMYGPASPGFLTGINLKNNAGHYVCYLLGRDTAMTWLNAKHLTAEQQNWLESEIQARCFAHIPPANRPRIVKGGPTDPIPLRSGAGITVNPSLVPNDGHVIVYANLIQTASDGRLTLWDQFYDGLYDCGGIALNGGDASTPPYGFSIIALVQEIGSSISGNGLLQDPFYSNRSTRAEHTILDMPSIADMKLDWQVILETPGEFNNSNIEAKYFEMPE